MLMEYADEELRLFLAASEGANNVAAPEAANNVPKQSRKRFK